MPHSATTYDTDADSGAAWTGLSGSWWDNRDLAGAPRAHGVVDPVAGAFAVARRPAGGQPHAGTWSARWTGEATMAATGTWGFSLTLTGRARLFLDDKLVVNAWSPHATPSVVTGSVAVAGAGRHRIRVDYAAQAGAVARLDARWTPPGGAQSALPASALAPRLSRPTRGTWPAPPRISASPSTSSPEPRSTSTRIPAPGQNSISHTCTFRCAQDAEPLAAR